MCAERDAVLSAVDRVFVGTDARDWAAVRASLAPSVHFDMTSVAGGEPATLTPEMWKVGLFRVELEFLGGKLELEEEP